MREEREGASSGGAEAAAISIDASVAIPPWDRRGSNDFRVTAPVLRSPSGLSLTPWGSSSDGRWALDFDIMYGRPMDDFNAVGVQLTINVLSH